MADFPERAPATSFITLSPGIDLYIPERFSPLHQAICTTEKIRGTVPKFRYLLLACDMISQTWQTGPSGTGWREQGPPSKGGRP